LSAESLLADSEAGPTAAESFVDGDSASTLKRGMDGASGLEFWAEALDAYHARAGNWLDRWAREVPDRAF
jgi:hypothetical protein